MHAVGLGVLAKPPSAGVKSASSLATTPFNSLTIAAASMPDIITRDPQMDKRLLDYALACYQTGMGYWTAPMVGTTMSRRGFFDVLRKRYDARRSVACLDSDVKDKPFPRSSNIGIGAEQIFGEFLIPVLLANTRDLEPALQAVNLDTDEVDDARTTFHDTYHRRLEARALAEASTRELLKVGSCFHKWTYETIWKQSEASVPIWVHPLSKQPLTEPDPQTGQPMPVLADPHMPDELRPRDQMTNRPYELQEGTPSVTWTLQREGPTFCLRPPEAILFPKGTTEVDPAKWDWLIDTFEVSPWWFLGREGDPWEGKLQNLPMLWKHLGINPDKLNDRPKDFSSIRIKLAEYHGPYAVTASKRPAELVLLFLPDPPILLGWRLTPFPRRPYFNRQVWNRGTDPIGKGIPETTWGLRDALDASVNQDADSGNLWNHPPVLISDLAMLDDEEYELTGPGTRWIVRDINGARVLNQPPSIRNPIERENWLMGMLQRLWGVTDLNLNAPTSSLSPNVTTARGTEAILNQGNIKFGHLTKRLAEADTREYQFVHDLFAKMLANPITVPFNGQSLTIQPKDRESFFAPKYRISAIGNGITTNPLLRHRMISEALAVTAQSPLVAGDLELQMQMLEDYFQAQGLRYHLKTPQQLEQSKLFLELLQTPAGQTILPQAMQQTIQAHQAMLAQGTQMGNGQPNGQPITGQPINRMQNVA